MTALTLGRIIQDQTLEMLGMSTQLRSARLNAKRTHHADHGLITLKQRSVGSRILSQLNTHVPFVSQDQHSAKVVKSYMDIDI